MARRPAQVRSKIRRLVRALAVGFAAGALALVVVGQPVARAQFSGVPGLVAYFNDQTGNAQIFTIAETGGAPTQLTHDSSNDVNPVWSPDGSKIAFESDRDGNYEIYVMNADGSNQTRLTTDPGSDVFPAWSPDGSKIAFASNRDGNYEIYVMNADGTAQTRLTTNPATDTTPSWSPDGSRIAFSSTRTGNGDIYVMNADGSNPVRLTTYAGEENGPDWSVTGNRIAFNRLPAGGGEFNILTMRADGSDLKQLSTRQDSSDPSWSPDDTHIVFDHSGTITTMSPTGTGLASLGVQGARPNWQPASSGLALTAPKAPGIETSMNLSAMLKLRNGSAAAQTIDVTVSAGGGPAQPLGHATTDSTGAFSLAYTPAAVGDYTFVASWAGDGSPQPAA